MTPSDDGQSNRPLFKKNTRSGDDRVLCPFCVLYFFKRNRFCLASRLFARADRAGQAAVIDSVGSVPQWLA